MQATSSPALPTHLKGRDRSGEPVAASTLDYVGNNEGTAERLGRGRNSILTRSHESVSMERSAGSLPEVSSVMGAGKPDNAYDTMGVGASPVKRRDVFAT